MKAFKKAASDSSHVVVLVDKEGRGIKFSSKNKPEMFVQLADYLQSVGSIKGTILDEEQAGFDLLPAGERPGRVPESASTGHRRKRNSAAHSAAQIHAVARSADSFGNEGEAAPALPKHIRKIKHQNRQLRKKIRAKESSLKGTTGKDEKEK